MRQSISSSSLELLGQTVGAGSLALLLEIDLHALEAELVGGDNIVDDYSVRHVLEDLCGVELVVETNDIV